MDHSEDDAGRGRRNRDVFVDFWQGVPPPGGEACLLRWTMLSQPGERCLSSLLFVKKSLC